MNYVVLVWHVYHGCCREELMAGVHCCNFFGENDFVHKRKNFCSLGSNFHIKYCIEYDYFFL